MSLEDDVRDLRRIVSELSRNNAGQWARHAEGGGPGSGGSSETGNIILIDFDFEAIKEADPSDLMDTGDVELTEEETGDGYEVVFQDPPDSDYDTNQVDSLNRWQCKPPSVSVKYFEFAGDPLTGTAESGDATSMVLEVGASTVDGFYDGATFEITGGAGSGQSGTIVSYDGDALEATFDDTLGTPLDNTSEYTITPANLLRLKTTVVDDAEHDPPRKIGRYAFRTVWYIDGEAEGFEREEHTLENYPDYPESEAFPPDGEGTYQEMPDGYFKKRYRAGTNYRLGREWIDFQTCIALPKPPLVPVEEP